MNKIIIFAATMLSLISVNAYGFDEQDTHPRITVNAVTNSKLYNYLTQNLGLVTGYYAEFTSDANIKKPVWRWLRDGSSSEDHPMCRASNHFLDPLKPWDVAYMTDSPWWINTYCYSWSQRYSNVTWATGYLAPAPSGTKTSFTQDVEYAPMNWDDARKSYYEALTETFGPSRDSYFAQTFQTLGQVLHLIQDMAVPAHVRNDFQSHLDFSGIIMVAKIHIKTSF